MKLNKEFWEKVYKDFTSSPQIYICWSSALFHEEWSSSYANVTKIKGLEKKFIEENKVDCEYFSGRIALFSLTKENVITLKEKFLNWIIKNEHYES